MAVSTSADDAGVLEAWDARTAARVTRFPMAFDKTAGRTPAVADLDGDGHYEITLAAANKLLVWKTPSRRSPGLFPWPQIHRDQAHTSAVPIPAVQRSFVSPDPDFCSTASFICQLGWTPFHDACGCGCLPPPGPGGVDPFFPDDPISSISDLD